MKIFGQSGIIAKRLFGLGKDEDYYGILSNDNSAKEYRNLKTYKGIVYACINLIAEQMGSYEPQIYRKDKKTGIWKATEEDHEFLQLLRRPGGKDDKAIPISMFSLLYATAAFIELQGDVYWYMAKGVKTGKPREIVILRADTVGRELDDKGDIKRFYIKVAGGQKVYMEIDEVLPFVGFNPENPYVGLGTVDASKDYIQTDEFSTTFTKNFFKNNAGVSGVLELAGEVTKTAFRKFVRAWRTKHEGVDNAGKTAIIRASEAKFTKIGLGLNELDMSALRKMSMDDIAMMFRVPLALLGKLGDGVGLGRGNIETLEYIFAKYNIEPKMKRMDDILQFAFERYYGAQNMQIGHENIVPENEEAELAENDKAVDRWKTRNEIRADSGLPPIDGGDQLFVSIANIPVNESSPALTPPAKGIKVIMRRVVPGVVKEGVVIKRRTQVPKKKDPKALNYSIEKKENFRLSLMRNQKLYERRYGAAVKPLLNAQEQEALVNLEAHANAKTLTKEFQLKLFDDAAADAAMQEKLVPVLTNLADQQGALALVFAGDDQNVFRFSAKFDAIIKQNTRRMASRFNDETIDLLNTTLAEGIALGESLGKLKSRVEDVYSTSKGYRAARISRTETLRASNEATNEAYRQTGYVTSKEWYVNPGADEECAAFDGKVVGLDDSFIKQGESYTFTGADGEEQTATNEYDDVDSPPLHPNCRCTIIPVR